MIVLTGGAGFLGSCLLSKFNREGIDNILIVDNLGETDKWKNLNNKSFIDYINKKDFIRRIDNGDIKWDITSIIHMGACSSTTEKDADYLLENNYHYTKKLTLWSLKNSVRLMYASSGATYGDGSKGFKDDYQTTDSLTPLNIYGYSKHLFDIWAIREKVFDRIAGFKFFNVFGPNEYHKKDMSSVVLKEYKKIKNNKSAELFKSYNVNYADGQQKRDFIYVKDCVDVIWWFYNNPEINGLYNLGSGKARTWNDLVFSIFKTLGMEYNIKYIEMPEKLKSRYQYFTEADMSKIKSIGCPLEFHSLENGINDYVMNYLEKNYNYM